ncbi:carboxypeptidase-like regulatory domain-containing protein, partial [Paraburkholderia sp. SIMBA_053]
NDAADRESAQRVALTEGEGVDGIDAALDLGGSISGRVMRQSDGEPLESVTVRASTPDGSSTASVATDSDGAYRIPGLRGGDYIVSFTP